MAPLYLAGEHVFFFIACLGLLATQRHCLIAKIARSPWWCCGIFALWLICPTGGRVLAQNYWWDAGISESGAQRAFYLGCWICGYRMTPTSFIRHFWHQSNEHHASITLAALLLLLVHPSPFDTEPCVLVFSTNIVQDSLEVLSQVVTVFGCVVAAGIASKLSVQKSQAPS